MRLVLLPGFDGTGRLFEPLRSALPDDWSIVSASYSDERRFEEFVDTALALMPSSDAVVVAESFSGPIALSMLLREPARFRCAVLCATFVAAPHRRWLRLARLVPNSVLASRRLQREVVANLCLNGERNTDLVERVSAVVSGLTVRQIRNRLNLLASADLQKSIGTIKAPTLYLRARRDRIVDQAAQAAVTNLLASCQTETIDGPHLLLQSRPKECARAILAFVDRRVE